MHPVCSVDGVTYDNKCKAECNQAEVCPEDMFPVCSVDGITYDNKCKAECNQAEVQCNGKCPCGNYVFYYSNQTKRSTIILI